MDILNFIKTRTLLGELVNPMYERQYKRPTEHLKEYFLIWWYLRFYLKSNNWIFGPFAVWKLVSWFFFEMSHFCKFEIFEIPYFQNQIGIMGHFKYFEHKEVAHFEWKSRDYFSNRKGTENSVIRFSSISNKNANAFTWENTPSNTFWGISYYLP